MALGDESSGEPASVVIGTSGWMLPSDTALVEEAQFEDGTVFRVVVEERFDETSREWRVSATSVGLSGEAGFAEAEALTALNQLIGQVRKIGFYSLRCRDLDGDRKCDGIYMNFEGIFLDPANRATDNANCYAFIKRDGSFEGRCVSAEA